VTCWISSANIIRLSRARESGHAHCYCHGVSIGMIAQHTMTFHLPGFFSVVKDLEDLPAIPGLFDEPDA